MPLVLSTPKTLAVTEARITSIRIQSDPLVIVISYDETNGSEIIASSAQAFEASDLEAVDPDGNAYDTVKNVAYWLLQSRIGGGTVA